MITGYIATLPAGDHVDLAAVIFDTPVPDPLVTMFSRLGSESWVFDDFLSSKWGKVVYCSRIFSALWRNKHAERPEGFPFTIHAEANA